MRTPSPFFMLPFDHRAGFAEKILGFTLDSMSSAEIAEVSEYKKMVWESVLKTISSGVPKDNVVILIDGLFGKEIIESARKHNVTFATCIEKSGQDSFSFDAGENWRARLYEENPDIVKTLVRWHPDHVVGDRKLQLESLNAVSQWCIENDKAFMFELLIPNSEKKDYLFFETEVRPQLMQRAVEEFHNMGIEPRYWKVEGIERREDLITFCNAIRKGGRNAEAIILGRNEGIQKVEQWLAVAKNVEGVAGFAVGRTVFLEPLLAFRSGKISRASAIKKMTDVFLHFITYWRA